MRGRVPPARVTCRPSVAAPDDVGDDMPFDRQDHLQRVPLFAGFNHSDLAHIDQISTELSLTRGHVVMRQGAVAHELVIVLDGTLEVVRNGEHIADIGPGEFAGETALLLHSQRNSTVSAKTDVTLLHIDGRGFATLLEEVPQLAVKMLPIVAARAAGSTDHHSQ